MNRIALVMHTTSYGADGFVGACGRVGAGVVLASDRCHVLDRSWHWPADSLVIDFADPDAAAAAIAAAHSEAGARSGGAPRRWRTAGQGGRGGGAPAGPGGQRPGGDGRRGEQARDAPAAGGVSRCGRLAAAFHHRRTRRRSGPRRRRDRYPRRRSAFRAWSSRSCCRAAAASCAPTIRRRWPTALARLSRLLADPAVRRPDPAAADQILIESFVPGPEFAVEGHPDARAPTGDGALRQARSAGRSDVRGDAVRHAVAPVRGRPATHHRARPRPARGRWASRPGPCTPSCAGTTATRCSSSWRRGRSAGCARAACALPTGLSLEDVVVRHALGDAVPAREDRASGVMMIPVPARVPSALRAVDGVDDARAVAGVDDVVISTRVGETLTPLPEGSHYTGFIFASGDTAGGVERRCAPQRDDSISRSLRWSPSRADGPRF